MSAQNKVITKHGGSLVMTSHHVYSRAYHKVMARTGEKQLARKGGQRAVELWRKGI